MQPSTVVVPASSSSGKLANVSKGRIVRATSASSVLIPSCPSDTMPRVPSTTEIGLARGNSSGQEPSRSRSTPAPALPTTAEELFEPLSRSKSLPDWAEGYLALLAESTNSQGAMQKHLMRLLLRGAAHTQRVAQFTLDPMDGVFDTMADAGSMMLLSHFAGMEGEEGQQRGAQASGAPGAARVCGWKKLRLAVLGASQFKAGKRGGASPLGPRLDSMRSKDDSCLPQPSINPVHGRVLSLMLSMMMSGVAGGSGVSSAIAEVLPVPHVSAFATNAGQAAAAISSPQGPSSAATAAAQSRFGSFARAPSLISQRSASALSSAGSGVIVEGVFNACGGMAATARRLLRGDSKCTDTIPGFSNALGAVFETVEKSMEEVRKPQELHRLSQQGMPPGQQQ